MEQEVKFEKALSRLEEIVEALEAGEVPLEDALKHYEEGVKLARLLAQKLNQAETKIETLTKALNGQAEALDPEPAETRKTRKTKKSKDADEDAGLLL